VLHPLDERFGQDQKIPSAVIYTKRRETVIIPSLERVVQGALPIGKSAFAAPPEDTGGRDGCRGESEHFRLAANQPDIRMIYMSLERQDAYQLVSVQEKRKANMVLLVSFTLQWREQLTTQEQPDISMDSRNCMANSQTAWLEHSRTPISSTG
jgi:hypothetical protein